MTYGKRKVTLPPRTEESNEASLRFTDEIRRAYESIMQAKQDAAAPALEVRRRDLSDDEQEQLELWQAAQADALDIGYRFI